MANTSTPCGARDRNLRRLQGLASQQVAGGVYTIKLTSRIFTYTDEFMLSSKTQTASLAWLSFPLVQERFLDCQRTGLCMCNDPGLGVLGFSSGDGWELWQIGELLTLPSSWPQRQVEMTQDRQI